MCGIFAIYGLAHPQSHAARAHALALSKKYVSRTSKMTSMGVRLPLGFERTEIAEMGVG
jgi:hypothetical protein